MADKSETSDDVVDKKEWVNHSLDDYTNATQKLVHHSFKTVNTNAEAGGVRVAQSQGIKLPYIGVRTLLGHNIDVLMDRYEGAHTARIYSQISQVAQGLVEGVPLTELGHIQRSLEQIKTTSLVQSSQISPRVRQILLPRADGGYLSITPISAAGVSHQLKNAVFGHNQKLFELRKADDETAQNFKRITLADFPIGGAKHVNPGGLVFSMRAPIIAGFPTTATERSRALSLHHYGIRNPRFPKRLHAEYVTWRNKQKAQVDADHGTRAEHRALIAKMVKHFMLLGADAFELLNLYKNEFPVGVLLNGRVGSVEAGLIDPARRTATWKYDFASWFARRVAASEKDEARQFEYSQAELNQMAGLVKDCLK